MREELKLFSGRLPHSTMLHGSPFAFCSLGNFGHAGATIVHSRQETP